MKKTFKILLLCFLSMLESKGMKCEEAEGFPSVITNEDFLRKSPREEKDIWEKSFGIMKQYGLWVEAKPGYDATKEEVAEHFNAKRVKIVKIATNAKYATLRKLIEAGKQDYSNAPSEEKELLEEKQQTRFATMEESLINPFCFEKQNNHYRDLFLVHEIIVHICCAAAGHIEERRNVMGGWTPSIAGPEIHKLSCELLAWNAGALASPVFNDDPGIKKDSTIRQKMNAAFCAITSEKKDFNTFIEDYKEEYEVVRCEEDCEVVIDEAEYEVVRCEEDCEFVIDEEDCEIGNIEE